MAQLSGEHDNLPAMMTFMSNEIRQDMPDVEGKVTPGVGRRDGDRTAPVKTERQQTDNASATATKRRNQLLLFNLVSIDGWRHRHAVFLSQRFDPHAPRIVDVTGNHPHCSSGSARHFGFP